MVQKIVIACEDPCHDNKALQAQFTSAFIVLIDV